MSPRVWLALAAVSVVGGVLACAEWAGPRLGGPRLAVVPVFGSTSGTVLVNDLDRVRVTVQPLTIGPTGGPVAGPAVADTTVPVDTAGNARVTTPVVLFINSPQLYSIRVQGIRSRDGVVLYAGSDTVTLQAGHAPRVDSVPVAYLGPCQLIAGCVVVVAPQNVTLAPAASLVMTVVVDSLGVPVPNVPVRLANVTPRLIGLAADLTVTALSGTSCGPARVAAAIRGATDTLRLGVNAPVTAAPVLFAGDSAAGLSSGVFCQNTDGTGTFHLSPTGATGVVNPRYSPDRQRVAFTFRGVVGTAPPPSYLYVVRWAGDTAVAAVVDTSAYRPRWSPNGAHLAFACGDGIGADQDVCVFLNANVPLQALASAPRIFVTDSVVSRPAGPSSFAWDPLKPDRLAFVRDSTTVNQKLTSALYTANFDGTGLQQLTAQPLDFGRGVLRIGEIDWSPRGDVIVFSATDTQLVRKLYLINRDGTGARQLTQGSDRDSVPVFSPDGTAILFQRSTLACALEYWRIGADSRDETQVSTEGFTCDMGTAPLGQDWSPDGTAFVVVGRGAGGGFAVYRLPAGTSAATYLKDRVLLSRGASPPAVVNDMQPSWRP
ncbi:MAG TPA: hypothetical protein VEU55_07550 [Gemmatimonadales bacterium]|nr:hypothetical protein [Gemmatimonadales bacterium]